MKPNVTTIPDAARRKGVTRQAIHYALRVGLLNWTRSGTVRLVHLDGAFESYTPNPKQAGVPKPRRRDA